MRRLLLALALIVSTLSQASAADTVKGVDNPNVPALPSALQEQKDQGAQIFYLGRVDVLEGWMMIRTGQPEFYYSTPGNKALVMGILFNEKGEMITGEQVKKLQAEQNNDVAAVVQPQTQSPSAPAQPNPSNPLANLPPIRTGGSVADITPPTPEQAAAATTAAPAQTESSPAKQLYEQVTRSANVLWGQPDAPAFWAFIDPNCPHCQHFLKEVEPFVNSGEIAVHIVPVGYDEKSKKQGALVLVASDGAQRLLAYSKGQTDLLPVTAEMNMEAVTNNLEIMRKWKLSGTPIIVYQTRKGGQVHLIRGRPADINDAIADLKN